eukprot:CAMPEP_0172521134 /NCGR_PEP_ID=MMETSP1066-20121228/292404_1 /TAXON_ID=671091 /ORGANISM="Coscinodiscus wailesii, Strain CCMP2513" /LENGTH=31 /DNA_ID= /DNA_START= /DNA_END= /DNA_ORIENTATION=
MKTNLPEDNVSLLSKIESPKLDSHKAKSLSV